jgi:Fe2+ or Zn2+ uptake regulation protein
MNREQQFKDRLRVAGERVTTPRLAVFRLLLRHAPLSMASLIARSRQDGIDPATVYRTFELFRRLALVQEVGLGRNRLLEPGDDYHGHHHHFSCTVCGRITDFDSQAIEADLKQAGGQLGFEIHSHQLEATGICSACRAAGATAEARSGESSRTSSANQL